MGDTVETGPESDIRPGNAMRLVNMPLGTWVYNIEMIPGKDPDVPVSMNNTQYWMGPTIFPAVGLKSKVRDYGRVWDFEGKSGDIIPVDWSGPGRR